MLVLYCGTDGNQGNTSGGVGEGSTTNSSTTRSSSTRGGSSGGRGRSSGGSDSDGRTTGGTTGGPPTLCSAHSSDSCEDISASEVTDCPHLSTLTLSKEVLTYDPADSEPGLASTYYQGRYIHLDYRPSIDNDPDAPYCDGRIPNCPSYLVNYHNLPSSKQAKSNPRQDTILHIGGGDAVSTLGARFYFNATRLNYDSSKEYYIFYKREPDPGGRWNGIHKELIRRMGPSDVCECSTLPDVSHSQQVFGEIRGGLWEYYSSSKPPGDITIKVWLAYQDDDDSPCHFYLP